MYNELTISSKIKNYKVRFINSINDIVLMCEQNNTITFVDKKVKESFSQLSIDGFVEIDSSEDIKTLEGAEFIYNILSNKKANKHTKVIVIGGGVLQDLIGFCASTYCRSIQYTLIPTTLLAQADSCVGGKTSLNLKGKKNILGTFYPPSEIVILPDFTQTLSPTDLISGLGEIYKFHILQSVVRSFNTHKIADMVYKGLEYKIDIISRDEFDESERKFLNFGHTFGHALESISNNKVPHGVAVIAGCMLALSVSKRKNYDIQDYQYTLDLGLSLISKSGIVFKREWFELLDLLDIIKSDKKSTGTTGLY
jgi:3-dehydroquinate synthase